MKLYIAGPIRGKDPEQVIEAFNTAEVKLVKCGYKLFNPLTPHAHFLGRTEELTIEELKQIFREDIQGLLTCDGVALLKGWVMSDGASGEYWIARACRMPTLNLEEWLDLENIDKAIRQQEEERDTCSECGHKKERGG